MKIKNEKRKVKNMSTKEAINKLMNEYSAESRRLKELIKKLDKNDLDYRRKRAVMREKMYKYNEKWSDLNRIKDIF